VDQADQKIHDLQELIRALTDRVGLTRESINAGYNELASELDRNTISLKAKTLREKAIQDKIAELTAKARDDMGRDETLKQLQHNSEFKQQDVERARAQQKVGVIPQEELNQRISAAADALVRIEERKEALTAAAGGGSLSALNKELIAVSLDITEQQAIVSMLGDRISRWNRACEKFAEMSRLNMLRENLVRQENERRNAFNPAGSNFGGPRFTPQPTPPPSSAPPANTSPGNPASSPPSLPPPGR
jgi:hypothetical protein